MLGLFAWVCLAHSSLAQNIGVGTQTPASSAALDITATDKGVLIPRVALTSQVIAAPVSGAAEGVLVYNTNANLLALGGAAKVFITGAAPGGKI